MKSDCFSLWHYFCSIHTCTNTTYTNTQRKKLLLRDCSFITQEMQWSSQLRFMKESTLFQKFLQTFCKRKKIDNCRYTTYISSVQYDILYVNVVSKCIRASLTLMTLNGVGSSRIVFQHNFYIQISELWWMVGFLNLNFGLFL